MAERKSFWSTVPGVVSGIAATVTGLAVLIPLILGAAKHNSRNAAATGASPTGTSSASVSPTVITTDSNGVTSTAPDLSISPGDTSSTDNSASPGSNSNPGASGTAGMIADFPTLDFGSVRGGTTSAPKTVTFTNPGPAAATIDNVKTGGSNGGDFSVTSSTCGNGASVPPQGTCQIQVTFTPSSGLSAETASVAIYYHPPKGAFTTIILKGTGSLF